MKTILIIVGVCTIVLIILCAILAVCGCILAGWVDDWMGG